MWIWLILFIYFLFICRQESKETREASKHSPCLPDQSCPPPYPHPQSPAQSSTPCQRPQGEEEHIFTSRGAPQAAEGCGRCNSSQEVQAKLMKWVVGVFNIILCIDQGILKDLFWLQVHIFLHLYIMHIKSESLSVWMDARYFVLGSWR